MILMAEVVLVGKSSRKVETVIDLGATDYCFIDISMFMEYEKFRILLVGRTVKKEINF